MEQRLDFYSIIGFAPETDLPDIFEGIPVLAEQTAVFLDFDGTLVEIAETPDAIKFHKHDRMLLEKLSHRQNGAVSIVSGRNLDDLYKYLERFSGTVSGGHGAELLHAGQSFHDLECDLERLEHIKNAVREFAMINPGVLAEEKSFGIVLHFRQHPELDCKVHDFLKSLIGEDAAFELQCAKMAVEVKPKGISKATAIERIMSFKEFKGRDILFVGDDETDEDAFAWVNAQNGTSVKIGDGPTAAHYRTSSPETFKEWLRLQLNSRTHEA